MILTGEPLAVLDLHQFSGPRMKRIEDSHLERRTPGIVTLSRWGLVRRISRFSESSSLRFRGSMGVGS
jgi:hypothetical protein